MKEFLIQIRKSDKLLHLIGGAYMLLLLNIFLNAEMALFITLTFWTLKEVLWDGLLKKGTPELLDALMSAAGAFSIYFILML